MDKKLLEILACPVCKADVEYNDDLGKLVCQGCGLKYPVIDGIPVMIKEEAEPSDDVSEEDALDNSN